MKYHLIRIITSTIILFISINNLQAQKSVIDSLNIILEKSRNEERVDILNQITNQLIESDLQTAQIYAFEADSLSQILNYSSGSAIALKHLGVILKENGENAVAVEMLEKSLEISQKLENQILISNALHELGIVTYRMGNFDTALGILSEALTIRRSLKIQKGIGNTINEIGNTHFYLSNYSLALGSYFEALKIREELHDFGKMAETLNNIGLVNMYQDNLEKAIDYLSQSLLLKEKYGNKMSVARTHNNIGLIYQMKGEFNESLKSYFHALTYLNPQTDQSTITTIHNNIGEVYIDLGQYDKALTYMKKSLQAKEVMGEKMGIAQGLMFVGKIYSLKSDFKKAVDYGSRALNLAFEINSKKEIKEASENLFVTYEDMGDFKNAFKIHKIFKDYSDSLRNDSQSRELGKLEAKYLFDKEKAEAEKTRLEKEKIEEIRRTRNSIIIFSGFGFLIIIVVGASIHAKRLDKKNIIITNKNEELNATLEKLKSTQAQLVQSEKMASIGQLTAGIAHEINNPINFITTSLQGLQMNLGELINLQKEFDTINSENVNEKLKKISSLKEDIDFKVLLSESEELMVNISNGANRTSDIVQGLQDISRIDETELKKVNIHDGIKSTILILEHQIPKQIKIQKEYDDLPDVPCYPGKLNQVFMNVINNAIQAIKNKKQLGKELITIKTFLEKRNEKEYAAIRISDTGTGIPDNIKDKIFDPFFTTKDVGKGIGLGLSISRGIIEGHNGIIEVDSKLGEGTSFIIMIPMDG